DHDPSWSPTGDRIAFERGPQPGGITDGDLYVMNADGTGQTLLYDGNPSNSTPAANIASYGTYWSPDGASILFSIDAALGTSRLYTIPAAGGLPTALPDDGYQNSLMSWAPAISYTLTVTTGGGGTVTSSPAGIGSPAGPGAPCLGTCSGTFADGTAVT